MRKEPLISVGDPWPRCGAETAIAREVAPGNFYGWLRGRFYRSRGPTFGLREALFRSTALDTWHRYAALMEAWEKRIFPEAGILVAGAGRFGLELLIDGVIGFVA